MTTLIPEWLGQRAALTPNRTALSFEGKAWTFAELDRWAEGIAEGLRLRGVRPGDRVALLADNSAAFAAVVHAVPRTGSILLLLNSRLTATELAWQLTDCRASLVIGDERNQVAALRAADEARVRSASLDDLGGREAGRAAPPRQIDLDAVHSIVYTSGTTGRPKGALLTFGNQTWSALGSLVNLGLQSDDCWLACLPLFHVGGLAILIRGAIYGIRTAILRQFEPAAVNAAIDRDRVSIVSAVAIMLQRMLDARDDRPFPATLRGVLLGGGPAPRDLLERATRIGVPVIQTYGLTETASQVTTLAPEDALVRLGSAGKPLFPTEVRIVDTNGQSLPPGAGGEIVVRGPTVSPGYFGSPARPAEEWLHTGDIGILDRDGYLTVLDRRDDLIVTGGENVYPAEVEAALRTHPLVEDAGVAGVSDADWGQRVIAFVVPSPGATVDIGALVDFCRQRLAGYKAPREIRIVEDLPRNAAGKLLRSELRRRMEP
ncbi:MAG: o-succinylbenzoate--CoA ligase [Dehalococcoidia bacterium]